MRSTCSDSRYVELPPLILAIEAMWAAVCPTAMSFVPGEHDGISHNPREFSTPEQCANGANVLLHTVCT